MCPAGEGGNEIALAERARGNKVARIIVKTYEGSADVDNPVLPEELVGVQRGDCFVGSVHERPGKPGNAAV
ncbi:hypothetical protein HY29_02630 [Hyphomonas beringensis]|uniref:Uncharacterized protein n=1 Tax=Hyphomonas beringensis TaxID=1280946 RepID=A0A062U8B7_9PROT|nr:hypothetical protein HY29_02630 [Hyphomonas beringensis]